MHLAESRRIRCRGLAHISYGSPQEMEPVLAKAGAQMTKSGITGPLVLAPSACVLQPTEAPKPGRNLSSVSGAFIQFLVQCTVCPAFFGGRAFATNEIIGLSHILDGNMHASDRNTLIAQGLQGA